LQLLPNLVKVLLSELWSLKALLIHDLFEDLLHFFLRDHHVAVLIRSRQLLGHALHLSILSGSELVVPSLQLWVKLGSLSNDVWNLIAGFLGFGDSFLD